MSQTFVSEENQEDNKDAEQDVEVKSEEEIVRLCKSFVRFRSLITMQKTDYKFLFSIKFVNIENSNINPVWSHQIG